MGAQPLPSPYIYLRFWLPNTHEFLSQLAQPYPSPSSSLAVLGEALLEYRAPPPPRRRAAAGWSLPQPLLLPLLDQEGGDVIRSVRMLNAEVPSVWHLVIDDLDHGEYDSIIPVL